MIDPDALADRLAEVAAQLVGRVRDDDPEANVRWLRSQVDPEQYEALLVVLAAAVPDDRRWTDLTAWCREEAGPARRLRPCGTTGAYARHRARGEQPCGPCMDAKRAYDRERLRLQRKPAGVSEDEQRPEESDPRNKVAA